MWLSKIKKITSEFIVYNYLIFKQKPNYNS